MSRPVYSSLSNQWVAKDPSFLFMCTAKTLIRLGKCIGWSESSLGAVILLVLSWGGSNWSTSTPPVSFSSGSVSAQEWAQWEHDKTNKWHVCLSETWISLGIHPVWSVFAVRMKKLWVIEHTMKNLMRLVGCPGWSESSLDMSCSRSSVSVSV